MLESGSPWSGVAFWSLWFGVWCSLLRIKVKAISSSLFFGVVFISCLTNETGNPGNKWIL